LLMAAAGAVPSALGVAAIKFAHIPVHDHVYVFVVAAFVTLVVWGVAMVVAPLLGSGPLRDRLAEKIARKPGGREFVDGAKFVGFAPTEKLMHWDGDTDWDVGFLKVVGDCLAFWGDRCRWSLPQSAVSSVELISQPDVPRILVRWSQGELSGVVALTSRAGPTVSRAKKEAEIIQAELRLWLARADGHAGPAWGWPPTELDAPGGREIGDIGLTGCVGGLAAIVIAVTTCLLVGLPAYTAGLKALGIMEAIAVGWPLLVIISEAAVAGR